MLNISIVTEPKYCFGDDIIVKVVFSNNGTTKAPVWLPVTATGKLKDDIFVLSHGTQDIEYHGMTVAELSDVVYVFPNINIEFSVRLAREYLIVEGGEYSLQLETGLMLQGSPCISACSGTSTFFLDKSLQRPAVVTWAQLASIARLSSTINYKMFATHHVYGATNEQFEKLQEAHEKASSALEYIKAQPSESLPSAFVAHYEHLFCANNEGVWPTVHAKYARMYAFMRQELIYHFHGSECDSDTYGYTFRVDPEKNIYLCDLYDRAPSFPENLAMHNTQMGVIVHEVSHKAVRSKDHYYGISRCAEHSLTCTDETSSTFTNAQCLQIFAERASVIGADSALSDNPGEL